jgi:uncharacterized protein
MKSLIIGCMTLYQWLLSPYLGKSCRFIPTCSAYGKEAVARHGAWRGLGLTLGRICRCRPGAAYGYDPVPEAEKKKDT